MKFTGASNLEGSPPFVRMTHRYVTPVLWSETLKSAYNFHLMFKGKNQNYFHKINGDNNYYILTF